MSLLTIRCWLHVIKTLQFIRTGIHLLEQHFQRGPVVTVHREAWELQLATESQELEDELRLVAQNQKAEDELLRPKVEVKVEVVDDPEIPF